VFTGSALILLITWFTLPWLNVSTTADCLTIGALWLILMLGLEIAFGRLIFRVSWKRLGADFDFRQGGLLSLGVLVLFLAPFLAAKGSGLF